MKIFSREHTLAYSEPEFEIRGSPEAFTSTTICKICGVKSSSGKPECHILKTNLELPYPTIAKELHTVDAAK